MRDLAVLTFQTLDGVMDFQPDDDLSGVFTRGSWSADHWDEVMEQVMEEAMAAPYDLLLGRKTYEAFAGYWPQADGPHAEVLNNATKYVATSTLRDFAWQNTVAITGDIAAEVARLKTQDGPLLQIHGSWQLIQTLLSHRLIDEFRLWTFPVLVGAGKRLFDHGTVPTKTTLVKARTTANGATMSILRRMG